MTFATLQDAWGTPTFQAEAPLPFGRPPGRQPHTRVQGLQTVVAAQAKAPRRAHGRHDLRRRVRALVAREGVRGLRRALGPDIVRELCRDIGGFARRRLAPGLARLLDDPEHLLAVLVGAFLLVLLADAMRSSA
jgi:hypothetical protein